MAKYDSTIFGEARSETADRRSGRTERIIRNESSADFLSAVSQPVRQMFYLQSGNCLGSRDRPSGTPSSPANGRAGFVPFGLGPKSGIIGSFPAARMLCRFARTPIRATATDRSPSDSAGCSRLPFSVGTTGHELIRSSDEPSDFAVGNIPVETDVDPMPFVHMVAGPRIGPADRSPRPGRTSDSRNRTRGYGRNRTICPARRTRAVPGRTPRPLCRTASCRMRPGKRGSMS